MTTLDKHIAVHYGNLVEASTALFQEFQTAKNITDTLYMSGWIERSSEDMAAIQSIATAIASQWQAMPNITNTSIDQDVINLDRRIQHLSENDVKKHINALAFIAIAVSVAESELRRTNLPTDI